MHYLIEHFGLLPGWLLAAFAIFFRYLVFAGLAFLLFYRFGHTFFRHLKIQNRTAEQRHMLAEILHSGYSALIFGLIGVGLYFMRTAGYTEIYTDWNAYGAWYIPISFLLLLVLHDTYFYWVHRLMHHPRLFNRLHRVHHQSFNPTPWASLSFHPLEAIHPSHRSIDPPFPPTSAVSLCHLVPALECVRAPGVRNFPGRVCSPPRFSVVQHLHAPQYAPRTVGLQLRALFQFLGYGDEHQP
jgi:sterol desaturase/sphingolipid hydroxylase (fatty acid hydroxylase superfamily)